MSRRGRFRRGVRALPSPPKVRLEPVDVGLAHLVDVDELVARAPDGADQLVVNDLGLLGLTIGFEQDQDAEQERDDRGGGVDHQLPGVAEAEDGTRQRPTGDQQQGQQEHLPGTDHQR